MFRENKIYVHCKSPSPTVVNMSWRLGNLTVFNETDSTSSQGSRDPTHGMMPRSVSMVPWPTSRDCMAAAWSLVALDPCLIYDSQTKEGRQAEEPV